MNVFPTYVKDVDIRIGLELGNNDLVKICKTNKYVKSICSDIWRAKIHALYPGLPIPKHARDLKTIYFAISESYLHLRNYAQHFNREMLDWLEKPINQVNWLLEAIIEAVIKKNAGKINFYYEILDEFLKLGYYPNQRILNSSYSKGIYPIALIEYNLFPDQTTIDRVMEYGNYVEELVAYEKFPSQRAINYFTENFRSNGENFFFDSKDFIESTEIEVLYFIHPTNILTVLGKAGKFPDQKSIDIASEKKHFAIIDRLKLQNKNPSQRSVNDAVILGAYPILEILLKKKGIFPDQWAINNATRLGDDRVIEILARYGKYPSQNDINIAAKSGHTKILDILVKYNIFPKEIIEEPKISLTIPNEDEYEDEYEDEDIYY